MSDSDVVIRVEGLGKKYSLHHEHGQPKRTCARRWCTKPAGWAGA